MAKYADIFSQKFQRSKQFSNYFAPEDTLLGDDTSQRGAGQFEDPESTVDLGKVSDVFGGTTTAGKIGGLLGKTTGFGGGYLGQAFDAGAKYAASGNFQSMAGPAIKSVVGVVSNRLGIPGTQALGLLNDVSSSVKRGMTPADALMGSMFDMGIDIGLSALGTAVLGPVGGLIGGLIGSGIDISDEFSGAMQGMSDWGKEANVSANVGARGFLDDIGFTEAVGEKTMSSVASREEVEAVMRAMGLETPDEAMRAIEEGGAYGSSSGYGGLGGIKGYGEFAGSTGLGIGQEGKGLGTGAGGGGGTGAGSEGVGGERGSGEEGSSDPGGRGGV